jgi:hypothetical protein
MDDALPVGGREGIRDLCADGERLLEAELPLLQPRRERLPLEALHHQEVDRLRRLCPSRLPPCALHLTLEHLAAGVVERADVRVGQAGDRLRLALEARAARGIRREGWRQDFDRDEALEARVARLVHLAHPARAEARDDLVGAETRSGREGFGGREGRCVEEGAGFGLAGDQRLHFAPQGLVSRARLVQERPALPFVARERLLAHAPDVTIGRFRHRHPPSR